MQELMEQRIGGRNAKLTERSHLLHVVDVADPAHEEQINTTVELLQELDLLALPRLIVFNKADLLDAEQAENIARRYGGVAVSATQRESLRALVARMRQLLKTKAEEVDQLAAGE